MDKDYNVETIPLLENKRDVFAVLGNICNEPSLLRENNFKLNKDDFMSDTYKIIFATINNLVASDAEINVIKATDIDNSISAHPKLYKIYERDRGFEYIKTAIESANRDTFAVSYHRLKKFSLLRHYHNGGFDIRSLYNYEKGMQDINYLGEINNKIEEYTEQQILEHFTMRAMSARESWDTQDTAQSFEVRDKIVGRSKRKKDEPGVGLPYRNKKYNFLFHGMMPGRLFLRSADTGCVDGNTEYFNGKGWTRIADYDGGMVMQFNRNGDLRMVKPDRYIKEECNDMFEIKSNEIHQVVSEDHNMIIVDETGYLENIKFNEFKKRYEQGYNDGVMCIDNEMENISLSNIEDVVINKVKSSDGYKYCFTVPSGMLVLRYNNTINITGNCGKSRLMMAEAAATACSEIYDEYDGWVRNGNRNKVLYISTELDEDDILDMLTAHISGVGTATISKRKMTQNDMERVERAEEVLSKADLFIEVIEDFSAQDIAGIIEKHVIKNNVQIVCYDYIQIVPKLVKGYTELFGMNMREDQILVRFAESLKQMAQKYNVFITTATQLNRNTEYWDATRLAGGKATANKVDSGCIITKMTKELRRDIDPILKTAPNLPIPNYVTHVYKNRLGRDFVRLYSQMDLGTGRDTFCFATDYNGDLINIPDMSINEKLIDYKDE